MNFNKRLLIVGGAGRNVGKTEFVCRLIQKFSAQSEIYGLKVSSIFPDEELYHGTHDKDEPVHHLFEEKRRDISKDTSRMLRAGAQKVYYLRSDDSGISANFDHFCTLVPENALIVCESNSLNQVVTPGLFIMVKSLNGKIKPRAVKQLDKADLIVVSDGQFGFPELDQFELSAEKGWQLDSPAGI